MGTVVTPDRHYMLMAAKSRPWETEWVTHRQIILKTNDTSHFKNVQQKTKTKTKTNKKIPKEYSGCMWTRLMWQRLMSPRGARGGQPLGGPLHGEPMALFFWPYFATPSEWELTWRWSRPTAQLDARRKWAWKYETAWVHTHWPGAAFTPSSGSRDFYSLTCLKIKNLKP